jgi:hypothetical protein
VAATNADVGLSTIPASPHFTPQLRAEAVEEFGEDGAWLLLSQLWYGWRTYYDLASGLVGGPAPADAPERPVPIADEYRIAVDLQVQAYVYAAAEQFATLLRAMCRHESGTGAFFEAFVGAPTNLKAILDDVSSVDRQELVRLVGDPATADKPPPQATTPLPLLGPLAIRTVNVGGIEVPTRDTEAEMFAGWVAAANELLDLVVKNVEQMSQLVEPPPAIPGADRRPQPLRAVDNAFRHGLRVLFHEAAPAARTFRVASQTALPEPPSVDLYMPMRGKAAGDTVNFATVSCTAARTSEPLETLRQLSLRTGQLVRAFVGFQTTGRPDLLLCSTGLELPSPRADD